MRCALPFLIGGAALCQTPRVYSPEMERTLGQSMASQMERMSTFLDDPAAAEYVQKLAGRLASGATAPPRISVKIAVAGGPQAAAFPGGFLFLSAALIARIQTEAELAAVLAHLIAHVTRPLTAFPAAGSVPIIAVDSGVCSRFAGEPFLRLLSPTAQSSYEQAADLLGMDYVAKAGYDPSGIADVLEIVSPAGSDRATLKAKADELSATRSDYVVTSSEFQNVRERIVQVLNPVHRTPPPSLWPRN
jgi:predicted Zn-dependent protease